MVLHIHTSHCVAPQHATACSRCRCSTTRHPAHRASDDVATASLLRHSSDILAVASVLLRCFSSSSATAPSSLWSDLTTAFAPHCSLCDWCHIANRISSNMSLPRRIQYRSLLFMLSPPNTPLLHSSLAALPQPPHCAWSSVTPCYRCLDGTTAQHSASRIDDRKAAYSW